MSRLRVLFLCTGNSCRSQMAEGYARTLKGDSIEAYSAGIETHGLNPYAVACMREDGVDISGHQSTMVSDLGPIPFDHVVTVCGQADKNCPVFPGQTQVVHYGFEDPPQLAANLGSEQEKLDCYRRVRDEIKAFIRTLPKALAEGPPVSA